MTLADIEEIVENNGFSISKNDNMFGNNESGWEIGQYTPEGEDWYEVIEADDIETFIENLESRVDGWDSEEEAMPYIEIRGQRGVPNSIRAILDDADWKLETLKKLLNDIKSANTMNESKCVKEEAYNYYWKDDILEVENEEGNDDIFYAVAENIQQSDPYYKDWDVYDIMSDIICLWKIEKRSRLYDYLLKWYGSEEEMLKNVRDVYETDDAIYFVTGIGYSIFSADLLGGTADGIAERDFSNFVDNGGKKVESKEIKTEAEDDYEEMQSDEELDDLIDELKNTNKWYEYVIDDIIESSEDYNGDTKLEKLKSRCDEILEHGCVSGTVTALIYYSDTVAAFNDYFDEIYDLVEDEISGGLSVYETLKSHLSETEIVMNTDQAKNWIVWWAYETVTYYFNNRLEELSE